jgi:large subunit ribosomal protein L18
MANSIKSSRRLRIKKGIRLRLAGTTERPRLSVYRSNKAIYAQIIDDTTGKTIVSASSMKDTVDAASNKVDQSKQVGKLIAEKAVAAGISQVVFDRNGYLYHGRIKSLAEGAREGGLQF